MLADKPAQSSQDLNQYAIAGLFWILSVLITGWLSYRWGLRSQKEAAKLKARNEVYALIDRMLVGMPNTPALWGLENNGKAELRKFAIQFSSQFPEAKRMKVEKALSDYEALSIRAWNRPPKGAPERETYDKEYDAVVKALKELRKIVSKT